MALITCPDCKAQISDAAPACVQCGRPFKAAPKAGESSSFRWLELVGFLLVAAGVVSCAASNGDPASTGSIMGWIGLAMFIFGRFAR